MAAAFGMYRAGHLLGCPKHTQSTRISFSVVPIVWVAMQTTATSTWRSSVAFLGVKIWGFLPVKLTSKYLSILAEVGGGLLDLRVMV